MISDITARIKEYIDLLGPEVMEIQSEFQKHVTWPPLGRGFPLKNRSVSGRTSGEAARRGTGRECWNRELDLLPWQKVSEGQLQIRRTTER